MISDKLLFLTRGNITFLAISFGGFALYAMVVIAPSLYKLIDLNSELAELTDTLEEQKELFPLYRDYNKELNRNYKRSLLLPKAGSLDQSRVSRIVGMFSKIVEKDSGLKLEMISPDYRSIANNANLIAVNLTAKGRLPELRRLLINIGRLDYIKNIESIEIKAIPGARQFDLKFWIILNK